MLINDYKPLDIFNYSETRSYFKMMPDETLTCKRDPCHGVKKRKERLTVYFWADSDSSENNRTSSNRKTRKPLSFKDIKSLPCSCMN